MGCPEVISSSVASCVTLPLSKAGELVQQCVLSLYNSKIKDISLPCPVGLEIFICRLSLLAFKEEQSDEEKGIQWQWM